MKTSSTSVRVLFAVFVLLMLAVLALPLQARASGFPDRPIKLVVPFPPGGGTDILARLLSSRLGDELGQPVVIENRPGASTSIAAGAVAKSPADGYTMLLGTGSTFVINSILYPNLPYDPVRDFRPVGVVSRMEMLLVLNPGVAADSVDGLIRLAKSSRGELNYGSPGSGTPHHLAMELFKDRTGIDITHVPYKGAAPAIQDLMGGRLQVMFLDFAASRALIDSKKLKGIAIASLTADPRLPALPTIDASGVKGFEVSGWFGLALPAGVPDAVAARIDRALAVAMADPAVVERLGVAGFTPTYGNAAQMAAHMRSEHDKWAPVVRSKGITAE